MSYRRISHLILPCAFISFLVMPNLCSTAALASNHLPGPQAIKNAASQGVICITGSIFNVGEAMRALETFDVKNP